jgi:non-heme chloroperoxidase
MGYFVEAAPGVKLFVEDVNPLGRKTILFLHGWPLNHRQFEYQFDMLTGAGFRCIGVDWRGFGLSDKPADGYRYDRLADDIHAVITTLRLSDITLAGHSTGGAIAIRYVSRHGGQGVSKLVLINAAAPVGFTGQTAERLLAETANDRPLMLQGISNQFFFQYVTGPFKDWFFQLGLQAAGWSTAAVIRMLRDEQLYRDLPRITIPTLIVHGTHDRVIPYAQAQELNRQIAGSRLVPFFHSGHGTFWEEHDKFNRLLAQFAG